MELRGKLVLVLGLGRFGGGVGVSRYVANQGARVRISDQLGESALKESIGQLSDLAIDFRLGGNQFEDLDGVDLVVVNPAIPPNHPFIQEVENRGIEQTTEVNLFFEKCPSKIIGIVGTNGKESVLRMVEPMVKSTGKRCYVGGNVGQSLLSELENMTQDDWVIFELSSFQLHRLKWIKRRPNIVALLNIQEDHIDWHGDFESYLSDKLVSLRGQGSDGIAVINADDKGFEPAFNIAEGRVIRTSLTPNMANEAVYLKDEQIVYYDGQKENIISTSRLSVPGKHAVSNALLAAGIGVALNIGGKTIEDSLLRFKGVPHALEFVGEYCERKYYNDSAATNPDAVMAALESFNQPVWIICGGYDKRIDYGKMINAIANQAKGVAVIGQLTEKLSGAIQKINGSLPVYPAGDLKDAILWINSQSQEGDIIVLSPGTSSYDQFNNLEERGDLFIKLVREENGESR